jgi:hypothetical protein
MAIAMATAATLSKLSTVLKAALIMCKLQMFNGGRQVVANTQGCSATGMMCMTRQQCRSHSFACQGFAPNTTPRQVQTTNAHNGRDTRQVAHQTCFNCNS